MLAYLKLALTEQAFEISFELEQSPLVRTLRVRPQWGERRTLVTRVAMNFGKVAWINCFRIMLNATGLDLSVDRDGPYKGAEVTWTGWAGFRGRWAIGSGTEHLVQFAGDAEHRVQGSGPTSRAHANMNQVTDEHGEARVEVAGPAAARRHTSCVTSAKRFARAAGRFPTTLVANRSPLISAWPRRGWR